MITLTQSFKVIDCTATGRLVAAEARRWIGTPYLHQYSTQGAGTDCLGLVRGVWRGVVGPEPLEIPTYSRDWSEPTGDEALMVSADNFLIRRSDFTLRVGDVLLFRMREGCVAKHLGIVSGCDPTLKFIHAYTGHGVVENSLSDPWLRRIAAVYSFPEQVK